MKGTELRPGMDVAVYTGTGQPDLNTQAHKARVVETGLVNPSAGWRSRSAKTHTRVHYYDRLPPGDLNAVQAYHPDRFGELRPFDPEAEFPPRPPELDEILGERNKYELPEAERERYDEIEHAHRQARYAVSALHSAQRVIPNRDILLPWADYVDWREKEIVRSERVRQERAEAHERREQQIEQIKQRLEKLALGDMIEFDSYRVQLRAFGFERIEQLLDRLEEVK